MPKSQSTAAFDCDVIVTFWRATCSTCRSLAETRAATREWHYVSSSEFAKLFDSANRTWQLLLGLARWPALRRGEALNLRWSDVGSFLVWTLAVCALAKALFGSLPAAELQYRLSLRDAPRRQRISRLNWEINSRTRWDEDVARGWPHAAAIPLFDTEVETRRHELQQLTRNSFAWRAFTYFMGCFACQTFWTAVATYAITRGVTEPAGLFFSAAYSSSAVLLSVLYGSGSGIQGPWRVAGLS